ncbi:hypothetical protein [Skermanella stibiiresistens]|nr:hypothetical protein [Skermanella stibiiresistens]
MTEDVGETIGPRCSELLRRASVEAGMVDTLVVDCRPAQASSCNLP